MLRLEAPADKRSPGLAHDARLQQHVGVRLPAVLLPEARPAAAGVGAAFLQVDAPVAVEVDGVAPHARGNELRKADRARRRAADREHLEAGLARHQEVALELAAEKA